MLEHEYPYTAKDGTTCKYVASKGVGAITSYRDVTKHNAGALRSGIA